MKSRRFYHLDVFARRPGTGNPLAVVLDAEGLDTTEMQRIAAWTNVIETTFVLPPTQTGADYKLRIFTPRRELAFAGHPSVGTAHAVLAADLVKPKNETLIQECGAGLLPVHVENDHRGQIIWISAPATKVICHGDPNDPLVQSVLGGRGLGVAGIALADNGRRWWLAELEDEQAVRQYQANFPAIAALASPHEAMGICVFARCKHADYHIVIRALMPFHGHYEDPASGAANAILAGYLKASNQLHGLGPSYTVSQGREIGRDAYLYLYIDEDGGSHVGGPTQTVVSGYFNW